MSTGQVARRNDRLDPDEERVRRTGRWRGVSALALLAGALGILTSSPGLVLVGVVGIAFAALSRAATPPAATVELERTVSNGNPAPDENVTVTVSVKNTGESTLSDLRVIDGVPSALAVGSGSPRLGTALGPGAETTFSYDITTARGVHRFDPALVLVRDVSGAVERATHVAATTETPIRCVPPLDSGSGLPLRKQTIGQSGRVLTDIGGNGVAFHTTREYRSGDPLSRIDWNRLAKTGDLSTVDFREERAAAVVLLIDAREEAYRASEPERENAVERAIAAAGTLYVALTDEENPVGIAALSPESCWLSPGTGATHRSKVRELLAIHPAFAPTPPDDPFFPSIRVKRLRRRLSSTTQLVICSPLCDDYVARLCRRFDAAGHRVTVVSPDPTSTDTPGHRLARTERKIRISMVRGSGIPVIDWHDEPLSVALARTGGRR